MEKKLLGEFKKLDQNDDKLITKDEINLFFKKNMKGREVDEGIIDEIFDAMDQD